MSQQIRRHETLPDLTTQDDLGVPDSRHDGLGLPSHPTDIADPRIFILSEVIKQTPSSSFTGLQSTLTAISTQMERIAAFNIRLLLPLRVCWLEYSIFLELRPSLHIPLSYDY